MSRRLKIRSKKAGLPPGSLVISGETERDHKITLINYNGDYLAEKNIQDMDELYAVKDNRRFPGFILTASTIPGFWRNWGLFSDSIL